MTTGGAFEASIREQAAAVAAAAEPPVEYVAARVSREGRFANAATAASGHRLRLDEPVAFGGGGSGPDPAEAMLAAIGASLSVTLTVHAALAAVPLDTVEVAMSGTLDPDRFFRPSPERGGGIANLRIDVVLGGRATDADYAELLDRALLACPVLRSIDAAPRTHLTVREAA